MNYEITGKLLMKQNAQQVTDRFRKREFVLEHAESFGANEFIETILFQLTQDKCELLDAINPRDEIKVTFNIKGRKWEKDGQTKFFNNLEAWKVEKLMAQKNDNIPPPPSMDDIPPEPTDDLPF